MCVVRSRYSLVNELGTLRYNDKGGPENFTSEL